MDQREELALLIDPDAGWSRLAHNVLGFQQRAQTAALQSADRAIAAGWEKRSPAGEAGLREAILALGPMLRVLELEAIHARRVNADTLSTPARWEPSEAFMAPLRQAISIALQVKQ